MHLEAFVLRGGITTSFAHGLVIVAAPESTDTHESWEPRTAVAHGGPDSIYLGVRDAAMGLVQVECRDDEDGQAGLVRLYSG
jgi:hypothetical protein